MKKKLSILLVMLLVICFSACVTPTPVESPTPSQTFTPAPTPAITAMSELSEIEISELLRQNITRDMSHEDVFSKLEAWGFIKWRDISVTDVGGMIVDYVSYVKGDVVVLVGLDMEYHVDWNGVYSINSYKSDQVTVNGVSFIRTRWVSYEIDYYEEPYVVPERVAEQRTIQSFLNENIKLGDNFSTATKLIEEFGLVLTEEHYINGPYHKYQYGNYKLYISGSDSNVDNMYLEFEDVLFAKRMEN